MATAAKRIRIDFDETAFGLAEEPGRLVVTESTAGVSSLPVLAHKCGMTPVVKIRTKPSSEERTPIYRDCPYGVAVNYETGNIYVSGRGNDRIQVFDCNGKYLYKFGDDNDYNLRAIAISGNRVFILHVFYDVSVYDLNGILITQFRVIVESEWDYLSSIAISEMNGDIYVSDYYNCIIQVFSKELPFKSQFGQGILVSVCDIKLTNEFIYVLTGMDPFLYSFTYDFTQTHSTAISSISKHLDFPRAFCIDRSGHFIISDHSNQISVFIYNQQGELLHTITDDTFGVWTLDSKGRILVVDCDNSLVIY